MAANGRVDRLEKILTRLEKVCEEDRFRWRKNDERWRKNDERWQKNDERWQKNDERWQQNHQNVVRMLKVLEDHGKRLKKLEERADATWKALYRRLEGL